jgi:hypothetical protein
MDAYGAGGASKEERAELRGTLLQEDGQCGEDRGGEREIKEFGV